MSDASKSVFVVLRNAHIGPISLLFEIVGRGLDKTKNTP
jgi:hypothetical protein